MTNGALAGIRANRIANTPKAKSDSKVAVSEMQVPHMNGSQTVRVLVYRPVASPTQPLPLFIHMHGGGFVGGIPEQNDDDNKRLVQEVQCIIISIDYRLSPESRYPIALEDCYSVLRWSFANAKFLKIDATQIAVGGHSAGGGLAAALALFARDRKEVPITFQFLIYPMLDHRTGSEEKPTNEFSGEFLWTRQNNQFGWRALLGDQADAKDVSPYASPARAVDLSGLPPTMIVVGALDLFVDENIEYARRLIHAGIPTELHVIPGAFHAFDKFRGTRIRSELEAIQSAALRAAFMAALQTSV